MYLIQHCKRGALANSVGKIVAEKRMGKYDEKCESIKDREETIMKWLVQNGF